MTVDYNNVLMLSLCIMNISRYLRHQLKCSNKYHFYKTVSSNISRSNHFSLSFCRETVNKEELFRSCAGSECVLYMFVKQLSSRGRSQRLANELTNTVITDCAELIQPGPVGSLSSPGEQTNRLPQRAGGSGLVTTLPTSHRPPATQLTPPCAHHQLQRHEPEFLFY